MGRLSQERHVLNRMHCSVRAHAVAFDDLALAEIKNGWFLVWHATVTTSVMLICCGKR